MDLLERHQRSGRRFEPGELIEDGPRVAVAVFVDHWKVFTFAGDRAVLLRDCVDRDEALARLAAG